MENSLFLPIDNMVSGAAEAGTSGVTEVFSKFSENFWPYVSAYKYWILAIGVALVFFLIATKAETHSQQQIEEELTKQEVELRKRSYVDPKKMGMKFYEDYLAGKGLKKKNYMGAIRYFEQCYANDVDICMKLAKMYHNGLAESYDKDGNKVLGIPPDARKSIVYYTKAAQMGDGEALLQMADIYHWGLMGFPTNKAHAKQMYLLLRQIGNDYQKGIAKDRLLQIKEEDGTVIGSGLEAADTVTGGGGFGAGFEQFGEDPLKEDFDAEMDNPDLNVQSLSRQLGITHCSRSKPVSEKFENNPHNVTDHVIDNTVKHVITALKPKTPTLFQTNEVFTGIKRWILAQRCGEDKKQDALRALAEIGKSLDKRSYEEAMEIDAIEFVWNRIHSNINVKNRNVLKQNLFNELAECIEYGEPVCIKGRIVRLIDVLNGVDPEVSIKPKWALNEEMLTRAAQLRNDAIARAPDGVRNALNSPNPTPDQVQLSQKFYEKFKRELVHDFYRDYVDSGLMSKELLNTELKKWIHSLV